jgi:hypothetical protein
VDDDILILYCLEHVCGLPDIAPHEFDFACKAPGSTKIGFTPGHEAAHRVPLAQ